MEIVLTELLEEQKKETITNVEMVSIVKKVLEKLEVLEQAIQPRDGPALSERVRAIQLACQSKLETSVSSSVKPLPIQTVVKHHLYFKTTAVIAVSFFLSLVVLIWLYMDQRKETNTYKENDIKYRYLKLNASPHLKKVLRFTDSIYLFASDSIKRKVVWLEGQESDQLRKEKIQNPPDKPPPKINGKKRHSN